MKIFSLIRVLAIFLLILIPLLYLYNYFSDLAENNKRITEELVKEQLLSEMNSFQDVLKPEVYIETAFQDLENKFKISDFNNKQYKYSFEGNEPTFFKDNFIKKAKTFLKENYGFEPFIFISSGYDFTDIDFEDKDKIFINEKDKNKFLYTCMGSILTTVLNSDLSLFPLKNKTNFEEEFYKLLIECEYKSHYPNLDPVFEIQVIKNFSVFFSELGKPGNCLSFFTNYFGNQRIFQYYNCLINKTSKENKEEKNFLGLYYVLIKSSDISIEKILNKASSKQHNGNFTSINRNISENSIKAPKWSITDKRIIYEVPFPSHFYTFIAEHNINSNLYDIYRDYLMKHSLVVSIDRNNIPNDYFMYQRNVEILIWVIFFIFLLYFLSSFFTIKHNKIPLSYKIRIIVLVAVSIPIIGLWIISYLGMKNEDKIILAKSEKAISERMMLLDKIKEDVLNNFIIDLLKDKKILADAYFDSTPNNFFTTVVDNKSILNMTKDSLYSYINLIDINGKNLQLSDSKVEVGLSFKQIAPIYRYLQNMNLLNPNTIENKKYNEQNIIFSSYTDSFFKTHNKLNVFAKESLLIPSESTSLKDKVSYMLLASPNNSNNPHALVYSFIYMRDLIDNCLNSVILEKHTDLLTQEIGQAQIKYAIFTRRDREFREKIPQLRVYPFRQLHLEAAKIAITKKNSGSEIREDRNNYYIKTWRYYNDTPVVFVAAAIVSKANVNLISGNILGLILLIYALLVVTLLSDFFSGALLEPIRTLSKFVNEISLGHFNLKINMKTGDEMEELGDSFNQMSEGLCEREKLKRFVSDKLYTSLEKSEEQKISKVNVTVLSSDIRSFTTISEQNEPEAVVSLLNDYFTLMEKSIVKYGGSIEKIVGDAISAAFYEEKNPEYALQACKAALEMRENLKIFNQERMAKGLFTIENGIGLATGKVMIGFAGEKARRREFLLIGNIIKSAESLEAMTKQAISSKVYIDKQTYDFVQDKIKLCPEKSDSEVFYRELQL